MRADNARQDKRLRLRPLRSPLYAPGRTGSMLRKMMHNQTPLTEFSTAIRLVNVGSSSVLKPEISPKRKSPKPIPFCDRVVFAPVRLARTSSNHNYRSRQSVAPGSRTSRSVLPSTSNDGKPVKSHGSGRCR